MWQLRCHSPLDQVVLSQKNPFLLVISSVANQSIFQFKGAEKDGLLRYARNDGGGAWVGWWISLRSTHPAGLTVHWL
jgi:hypothetical protein